METLFGDDNNLFRLLVEGVHNYAIFALDVDGTVLSWTPEAQRFTGYGDSEIIGRHFSIFFSPNDIARQKPWRLLEIVRRKHRFADEGWRVRKDGSRFWASVTITALYDNMGDLVGFGKVVRDLTEQRKAEMQALLDVQREALEAVQPRQAEVPTDEISRFLARLQDQLRETERQWLELESAYSAKDTFFEALLQELQQSLKLIGTCAQLLERRISGPTPLSKEGWNALIRVQRTQQRRLDIVNRHREESNANTAI